MKIINGKLIAENIYENLKRIKISSNIVLGIVLANDDEPSERYVKIKARKCLELGITVEIFTPVSNNKKEEIIEKINEWNKRDEIKGILVQLPLDPSLIRFKQEIIDSIIPTKDVDGLTTNSLGSILAKGEKSFLPATVKGIIKALEFVAKDQNKDFDVWLGDKNIVILNSSNLIGKPLAMYLSSKVQSIVLLNKKSSEKERFLKNGDIIISATGQGLILNSSHFKSGAVLIDVTSKKIGDKIVGDFDFESFKDFECYLTPVPNGIGPLTVACLIESLFKTE